MSMIIRFAVLFLFSGCLAAFPLFGAEAPDAAWSLCVESPEPVVRHGAGKLLEFLNGNGRIVRNGARRLVVAVAPEKDRLTSRITVTDDEVRVTGATPREALQGCYRLMDELENGEERPVLRPGTRTYTRMFSPRMVHSGVEIEKFPDAHMDEIARAGLDAILIYINEPPDGTRNGHEDIPALVKRAAEHGLDVYAYADFYWNPLLKNPCDPGAEDYYDSVFGSIVRNAPGLKGLICVGESCYFPERGESPWKDGSAKPDRHNGWRPHPDWAEFLKVVTKVTRRHNPDFDVVFWTYNWYCRPEKDRLALLERIPTNVTVHVTFEMGAPAYEKDGVEFHVEDYSITEPGPGTTFVSEARVCARRGIPLTSMSNTGGRTWDFGGLAFEPVPQAWMVRFDRLKDAQARWGLKGLMDSHHYGFTPNVVAKVAKAAFTREFGEREIAGALRAAAACDFGPDAADEVLSAWKDWSEAFQWHSARGYDQDGPLRIGPSYPLVRPGAPFPPSPRPVYEWVKGKRNGNGWLYLAQSYDCPPESLDGRIRTDERELALLRRGNSRLEAVLGRVPAARLPAARRMLGYGKYMEAAVRTLRNVRAYKKACLAGDEAARLRALDDEEANVRAILPWVEQDEKLGWEPSMRRVTDAFMLKWKLGLLEDARKAPAFDDSGEEWFSYRQIERGEPKNIPGIVNADFEDSTKFGKSKDGKSEYGRFGYNGNGGCRMWIREKFKLFRFPSDCKLKKGRTYTFSGMYRAVGNARGGFSWMMFVDRKYRKEKGGIDVEDLGDGWKRSAVTFTPECDGSNVVNCLDFQATPLRKMSEEEARSDGNYIDFDNLRLVEAVPVWRFCNVWPIQNRVYREGGRVRCRNSFVGDFFEKDAQPFYVVKLVAADGRTLAQRLCRDTDGVFTCAFGDLAYEGAAELVVALYDRRNRLGYGEKRVPVTVVPTPKPANGRPFITEDGRTLVNGEPFMPLGFWTSLGSVCLTNRAEFVRQLEMLHGAGFNAIVEYGGYLLKKKEDRDFFYGQCSRSGIRVFDGDMALASWDEFNRKPDGAERYRAKSLVYRDYPAIFAWFVTDECSADRVPALMAMRRILSETAPNIPMWPCNIFEPDPFLPGQDVQGGDLYPYRDATSTLEKADKRLAAFEACRPAACWHSPQCYNWQEMRKGQGISAEDYLKGEPDEDQMLSVAVLMASRSVTGFLFYSHFNIWRPSPAGDLGPVRWARMKNIAKEMNALKPFITSGIRRVEVPHIDRGDPTRVVALSDGQGRSRVLIVGLGLHHDCEIDLGAMKGLAGESVRGFTVRSKDKAVFRSSGVSCDILR